eukprot:1820104-Lingulodinium_polyedra.AAC.1
MLSHSMPHAKSVTCKSRTLHWFTSSTTVLDNLLMSGNTCGGPKSCVRNRCLNGTHSQLNLWSGLNEVPKERSHKAHSRRNTSAMRSVPLHAEP